MWHSSAEPFSHYEQQKNTKIKINKITRLIDHNFKGINVGFETALLLAGSGSIGIPILVVRLRLVLLLVLKHL